MHNVRRRPRNIRNNDRSNRSGDTTTMNLIVGATSSSALVSNRPLKVEQQLSDNSVHVKVGSPETSSLVLPLPSSISHPSKMVLPQYEAEHEDVHVLRGNNINKHKMETIRKMVTAATTNLSEPKSAKEPVPVVEGPSDYSDDDYDEHDDYTVTVRRSECLLQDEPSLVATNSRLSDDDEDKDDEYVYEDDGLSSLAWNYDYVYNHVDDDDDDEESFSSMCMNGSTSSRDIMDKEEDEMQTNITIVSSRRLRLGQRRSSSSSPRTKRQQEMDDCDVPVRVTRRRRSFKRFPSSSTSLILRGSSSTSCGDILSSRIKQSYFGRSRFGRAIATKYSSTRDINNSVVQENEADGGFVSVLPARSLSFKMEQVPEGNEEDEDDDDDDVASEPEETTRLSDDDYDEEEDEIKSTEEEKQEEMHRTTLSHSSRLSSTSRRFSPVPNSIYAKLCAGEGVHIRLVPENTRFAKLMAGESDIPIVPMRMKHSRFAKTRAGRALLTSRSNSMEPTTTSSSNNVEDGATIATTGTGSYYAVTHSS